LRARLFPLALLTSLCLLAGLLPQGCGKGGCNPLTGKSATVKLAGKADLPQGAPVTLNNAKIGEVVNAALDEKGKPVLTLCLEKKGFEALGKSAVFYVAKDGANTTLVAELLPELPPPPGDELVYLGFDSYPNYLTWRAEHIVKKGVSDLLKAIDGALK
jgi:hypothetical protein